jgi:hypothetical protein
MRRSRSRSCQASLQARLLEVLRQGELTLYEGGLLVARAQKVLRVTPRPTLAG